VNPGQIVETLNAHIEVPKPGEIALLEARIKLTANTDVKKFSYRPMAMHLTESSEVLDERIDDFTELIQKKHDLPDGAFGSPASQSTTEIVAVGRICSDAQAGKLNDASIVLETSRRMGAGLRVPLNVDAVPSFAFFPGQIVAVRGVNASGEYFAVKEVLDSPLLPLSASAPSALDSHQERLRGGPDAMEDEAAPITILVAAGPYTTDDSLDFQALEALCKEASATNADGLILHGPFLDLEHPLLSTGDFELPEGANIDPDDISIAAMFRALVAPSLQSLAENNPGITIMLVPSVRDAISAHVSWPQEPLGASNTGGSTRRDLGLPKQVKLAVSNPMQISLNEIAFGLSSQDVFFDLKKEEATRQPKEPNPLTRIAKYLIEQSHFFPLFPPSEVSKGFGTGNTGAALDTAYLKLGEWLNVRPDVLISPSALPPCAKVSLSSSVDIKQVKTAKLTWILNRSLRAWLSLILVRYRGRRVQGHTQKSSLQLRE
jgi:DNA polymerase alpha subunit B